MSAALPVDSPSKTPARSLPRALWVSLRPTQWSKNLLLYAPVIFTINQNWDPSHPGEVLSLLGRSTVGFLLFCLISSSSYLLNDVADRARDVLHPTKRLRPLAAGELSPPAALLAAALLALLGLAGVVLGAGFLLILYSYYLLNLAYTLWLKHLFLLDALALAFGFVLRAVAGAVAIQVPISPWLYLCTLLGSLLLGLGKRRHELATIDQASEHRPSLQAYTLPLMDHIMSVVAATTIMAYSLYTFTAENLPRNGSMMLTIPLVLFGVFRYLYLVHVRNRGGTPEDELVQDLPLMATVGLWVLTVLMILGLFRGT